MGNTVIKFSKRQSTMSTDTHNQSPTLKSLLARSNDPKDNGVDCVYMTYKQLTQLAQSDKTPLFLYRSHVGNQDEVELYGLRRSIGKTNDFNEYIKAIIQHTARTSGSAGAVMSLSKKTYVVRRFHREGNVFATIQTSSDKTAYKSIAQILVEYGDTLLKNKKIMPATLLQAVKKISQCQEEEYFYLRGDIPASHIKALS